VSDEGQQQSDVAVIAATQGWLERAVIGLGLCPFAAGVYTQKQIRFCVSSATSKAVLLDELACELVSLRDVDPKNCETSLLIHPQVLKDFHDYNQFLDEIDALIVALDLEGELQVASFHPDYQFAGSDVDDIENYSNRSPYPTLHLLREATLARAIASFPGVDEIGNKNMAALRLLGKTGWDRLNIGGDPSLPTK
jgi:hypothetical protein